MSSVSKKPLWARLVEDNVRLDEESVVREIWRLVSHSVPWLVCKTVDGACETCELFAESCGLFGLPKRGVSAPEPRPTRDEDDEAVGDREQETGTLVSLNRTRLQLKCPIRARHSSMGFMAALSLDTVRANIGVASRDNALRIDRDTPFPRVRTRGYRIRISYYMYNVHVSVFTWLQHKSSHNLEECIIMQHKKPSWAAVSDR